MACQWCRVPSALSGDLGFGVLKPFWERFPDQFTNAGVAEQNMTTFAVGMALEGKTVFTYSIGNFPMLRAIEQIRNDCAYHEANVKIVSVDGGFVYGALGMSHHSTEDLAIMRTLPNVTVLAPCDLDLLRDHGSDRHERTRHRAPRGRAHAQALRRHRIATPGAGR